MRVTGRTRLAGVVGWPVAHSRSPLLHNEWLRRAGIDGAYVPLPVPPDRLESALRGLQAAGFAGVNVTVPHKEAACRLSDVLSTSAQRCGAVNTLLFGADGRLHGDSTDGQGWLDSLTADGLDPVPGPVLVLGAGGAARAIVAALQQAGASVSLANRTRGRAEALARSLEYDAGPVRLLDWEMCEAALADYAMVVNTTAAGMGADAVSPCRLGRAPSGLVVADIVYVPRITPLLAEAASHGLRTVEGLGMLLHQARIGFTAWFGVEPVIDQALFELVQADLDARPL